jgi:hypothetical protein
VNWDKFNGEHHQGTKIPATWGRHDEDNHDDGDGDDDQKPAMYVPLQQTREMPWGDNEKHVRMGEMHEERQTKQLKG